MGLQDEEEMYRINVFDWREAFPKIMDWGGFDAVIGNPPYVRQEMLGLEAKKYFQQTYKTNQGTADLYVYFIEKAMQVLKTNGQFAYIVANKWMRANYGKPLRKWLTQQHIKQIIDFGDLPVFQTATAYPCILHLSKENSADSFATVKVNTLSFQDLDQYVCSNKYAVNQLALDDSIWSLLDKDTQALLEKLADTGLVLNEYVDGNLFRGILTGLNEVFVIDENVRSQLIVDDPHSKELIKPFLAGRDIRRYESPNPSKYLIFTRRGVNINQYPAINEYLMQFKDRLIPRPKNWEGGQWTGRKHGLYQWYEIQDTIAYYEAFDHPKIIIPAITKTASYTFDDNGFYSNDKTSIIATDDLYLLGLLNSKVLDLVLHSTASTKRGGYYEYKPVYVSKLPIRVIDSSNPDDVTKRNQIVALVEQILDLHKRLATARMAQEKTLLQRQISATDHQIDQLVYQLYDLTPAEIAIVEQDQT